MMNQLESVTFTNNSSDLAWQLFVASGAIIVRGLRLHLLTHRHLLTIRRDIQLATRPLKSVIFLHPLLACLAYVSSALAPPGAQTSIMGLLTIPVAYFPYVMVGMDLLSGGPYAAAQAVAGIIVGHLWWWAVWGGELGGAGIAAQGRWSEAPKWLRNWFGERERGRGAGGGGSGVRRGGGGGAAEGLRASGIEVVPPRRVAQASDSGHSWGSGQRLGT